MHSLTSIVGCVFTRRDTYLEWSRKIKSTLIYNNLWDGICEGKTIQRESDVGITTNPKPPTSEKELDIWKSKDKKSLAIINATISEEVSQHIFPAKSCFEALKTLKYLYDSHSKMELVKLMLKLFILKFSFSHL